MNGRSKYKSKKITIDGETFDSKGEYQYWLELVHKFDAKEITDLNRQVRVELIPRQVNENGKFKYHPISWIADYYYKDENGEHWVDFKGFETPEFKIKKKLFYAKYHQDIEIVKCKNKK